MNESSDHTRDFLFSLSLSLSSPLLFSPSPLNWKRQSYDDDDDDDDDDDSDD